MSDWPSPALGKLRRKLWDKWRTEQGNPPETLYHYTNVAGWKGIVSSQFLWATHIHHMNDETELDYGSALAREVLVRARKAGNTPVVERFLEQAEATFNPYTPSYSLFAFSLCADGNLPVLWRRYAARGSGYCIGFGAGELLNNQRSATPNGPRLLRVAYDRDEQVRMVTDLIETLTTHVAVAMQRRSEAEERDVIQNACTVFREMMTDCLACLKDSDWSEEQEWRLVFRCDRSADAELLKTRHTQEGDIPYVELDCMWGGPPWWGTLPIVTATVGPVARGEWLDDVAELGLSLSAPLVSLR